MIRVGALIEYLRKCDPNTPVVFRTLDADYGLHNTEPFIEDIYLGTDLNERGEVVEGRQRCLVLCSDEKE